jgi:hypothetical protein
MVRTGPVDVIDALVEDWIVDVVMDIAGTVATAVVPSFGRRAETKTQRDCCAGEDRRSAMSWLLKQRFQKSLY